jgi:RNA binding exosome subunit
MQVTSAQISAIVHATEDPGKVRIALNQVCSQELFQPMIDKKVLKGHFGNEITTITMYLRNRLAESFIVNLWNRLSALDRETMIDELKTRIDEEDTLHLRLDKQGCFRRTFVLKDQDAIKVQVAFREVSDSLKEVREFLESTAETTCNPPKSFTKVDDIRTET